MEKHTLESLRDEIDEIDSQIVRLLNQRVQAAVEIGRIKDKLGVDPYDPAREEQVFEKLRALNSGPMQADSLRTIYREVISASIALETPPSAAFAPVGTPYPALPRAPKKPREAKHREREKKHKI